MQSAPLDGRRKRLVEAYLKRHPNMAQLVKNRWNRLFKFCTWVGVTPEEIGSAATLALCKAAQTWSTRARRAKGSRFPHYAGLKILARVQQEGECSPANRRRVRDIHVIALPPGIAAREETREGVEQSELDYLLYLFSFLSNREWQLIVWRYGIGMPPMTYKEISEIIGITEAGIRKMVCRIIRKLRRLADRGVGDGSPRGPERG